MAHKLLSWFRRKITGDPGCDPKQKVFEAAQSGDAVLLDKVLKKLNCSERISVLSKQFINDEFSLPEREGLQVTPLIVAVENGNLDCVKVLLKYKADIEGRGDIKYKHFTDKFRHLSFSGCTPLFVAAVYGNVEILRCLLENGADINAVTHFDQNYYTPLMMAINYNHSDAVTFLIDQGADVNLQTKPGATALHHAVWTFETSLEIVSSLIENGADVNARGGINKWTPLMMATERGYCRMVTFLIEHGAYIDLQDSNGRTALHYATVKDEKCFRGFKHQVVSKLLAAGASHLCDNSGLTPLLLASNKCNVLMVEHLMKQREIAKEHKIDALELLGASLALEPHKEFPFYDVKEGFEYIKRGMRERFADPSHPLLKQQMEPVEAYQNRKESQTLDRASDISLGRGPAKFRYFREIPRNSQKNTKYREIRQKHFQIHVGKTYLILILALRPVLFTPNVQIYLETSSLQRINNVSKLPGVLDERCEKLGTNHNVNGFSIRSFVERTVVERANDYPC